MSVKIDIEMILKNALDLVQTQFNSEIAIVNAFKADTLVLPNINSSAYYFASMPKGAFNFNEFVVFGIGTNPVFESVQSDNNVKKIELIFEVVCIDGGDTFEKNVIYKLLRYTTALEQVFLKNVSKVMEGYGNLEVTTLVPSTIFNVDGKAIRSAGVSVTARITAR